MAGLPQMPSQAPRSSPRSAPSGGNFNAPAGGMGGGFPSTGADTGGAYNQASGFSEQQKIQRSVTKSKKNAGVLKAVRLTRQQLEQWLAQFGLKLLTSSVELQMTHNFLNSSYVIYPDGSKISLPMFLKQTDQGVQNLAQQINDQMSGIASHLEVVDLNSGRNPFEEQFYPGMAPMEQNQAMYQPQPQYAPAPNHYPQSNQMMDQNGFPNQNYYPPQPSQQPNQGYYPVQNSVPASYNSQPNYNQNQNPQTFNPNQQNPNQSFYPQQPFSQ